ncbi:winged helix-turn-helix domain-containing protein [Caulobacter segnis]
MSEGRLADRAYTGIVEMINNDGLEVGDRLPSESRLAEIFGMSRTVVREALVRLAADSITEARRGAGSSCEEPSVRQAGRLYAALRAAVDHGQLRGAVRA